MNLIGIKINHCVFGNGTVTEQSETGITAQFSSKACKFKYPSCFEQFITAADPAVQEQITECIKAEKEAAIAIAQAAAEEAARKAAKEAEEASLAIEAKKAAIKVKHRNGKVGKKDRFKEPYYQNPKYEDVEGTIEGSPEWFRKFSDTDDCRQLQKLIDGLRDRFLDQYSPDKLREMSGSQLLTDVFETHDSMMYLLTMDENYRKFGAGSRYTYLWPIRYDAVTGACSVYEKAKRTTVEFGEAAALAEETRDRILHCVEIIRDSAPLESINDYKAVADQIEDLKGSVLPWSMKYFQMIFPEYFPGMYASHTLDTAIRMLGLPGHTGRILKAGEISLYIRKCGIGNIIFGKVYGERWDWNENLEPCAYAKMNLQDE